MASTSFNAAPILAAPTLDGQSWDLEVVRGPDWLFVRPSCARLDQAAPLDETIWALLEQTFTYRVVLELDRVERLPRKLIDELTRLHARIQSHDGLIRLCGLTPGNQEALRQSRLDCFPIYRNREAAVMASRPR